MNAPIDTIRDGNIKAAIWQNEGQNGVFFSVSFARTYEKGDDLKDTNSFSGADLLKIAHLAPKAYDRIAELRAELKDQKDAA